MSAETVPMWSVDSPHCGFGLCAVFSHASRTLYSYFSLYIGKTSIECFDDWGKSVHKPGSPKCGGLHVLHIRSVPFP
jgi:hypothetical protein